MSKNQDKAPQKVTPMMAQYAEIKTANPDSLLFYRMGDFYELFFEDAVEASRALGITLTKRGKHDGEDIPMCGVPVHASDDYLQKLIGLGYRVSVCEQTEDPAEAKKRGAKSVVRRNVVRLVTPGTITEDQLLDARTNNFLCALAHVKSEAGTYALAWLDLSTGESHISQASEDVLASELARIAPAELILSDTLYQDPSLKNHLSHISAQVVPQPSAFFASNEAENRMKRAFEVKTLDGLGTFTRAECAAMAGLLAYVEKTQLGERPLIRPPKRGQDNGQMIIDPATRANLELTKTLSGAKAGSLLSAIDQTVTHAGSRLLAARLASPSMVKHEVNARLDAVAWFLSDPLLRRQTREILKQVPDMARALSRLQLERGSPRDLSAIAHALKAARQCAQDLQKTQPQNVPDRINEALIQLQAVPETLLNNLDAALADELPLLKRDGGFIGKDYCLILDETRALRDESRKIIAALQVEYAEKAEIKGLKIRHNNVLGYFVEVTAIHAQRMLAEPLNELFIHRQTLANAVRFTTPRLSELQSGIVNAAERVLSRELEIFNELQTAAIAEGKTLQAIMDALAELDVASANAQLADGRAYCRPLVDESLAFKITKGRHPVVEAALKKAASDPFVANSCELTGKDKGQIWLITGPNMAGKSTFLRQNALIAILAQMGMYVPAEAAHIGLIDRLFSRVGAADDLARGQSTFMVEMVETAAILNQAGERALVILDEIGRGTATFDGLSIAWAAIEHLHEANGARALFATHYHELTVLSKSLKRLKNATVKVTEWKGEVVFLHEIVEGSADRSYGIQVAKLAGLPDSVIKRSRAILSQLEEGERSNPAHKIDDLPLFALSQKEPQKQEEEEPLRGALQAINPDSLSPREALEILYKLKETASKT